MGKGEHTPRQIEQACELSPFASFVFETLLLCEWDEEFRRKLWEIQEHTEAVGITRRTLADMWETEADFSDAGIWLIAEQKSCDGARTDVYRLKSVVSRWLEGLEQDWESLSSYLYRQGENEVQHAMEPDEVIYPSMHRLVQKAAQTDKPFVVMNLSGKRGSGRLENFRCFCREQKKGLLLLDGNAIAQKGKEERREILEGILFVSLLEACEAAIRWDGAEGDGLCKTILAEAIGIWRQRQKSLTVLTEQPMQPMETICFGAPCVVFEIKEPDRHQTAKLWARYSAGYLLEDPQGLQEMMGRYRFTPGQVKQVFEDAKNRAWSRGSDAISREDFREICRRQVQYCFQGKAARLHPRFGWDDLVLAQESKELLKDISKQNRYWGKVYGEWKFDTRFSYGMGTALLFAGPPGTGKTMAAQVLAHEMEMELFRVDLSTVVSKYIGETEKNLSLIFDEAKKSLCILFFDEADVLFGKRTEVKDSQDKYSNMEAAFLLQKMEEYDGISILATNFWQNIDEAFKRRLKYVIEFSMPTAGEREKLWRDVFPPEVPLEENIDYGFLAEKFELTGSNIKNIAVNAAFMAATEDTCVGMGHLVKALRNEYKKSGKRLTREELAQYCMYF